MSTDFSFGPFVLDTPRGNLFRDGRAVPISNKGFRLLEALIGSPGRVLTKDELMQAGWGDTAVEESNLSVQIAALRKQLGPTAEGEDWITTVPRVGYRFVWPAAEPVQRIAEATTLAAEPRPSIAVLPFTNSGGEKEQEYLADGITEDIITCSDAVSLAVRDLA